MQVKVRHVDNGIFMIVLECRDEEVYDGCRAGFYVCKCKEVSSHVYSYDDVKCILRECRRIFVVCLGMCL